MLLGMEGFDNFESGPSGIADLYRTLGFIQYPPTNGGVSSFNVIARPGRLGSGACVRNSTLNSLFGPFQVVFGDRFTEFVWGGAIKSYTGFSPPADDSLILLFT